MTLILDHPNPGVEDPLDAPAPVDQPTPVEPADAPPAPVTARRIAVLALVWVAITVLGIVLVLANVGPLLEQREQRQLLDQYRTEIRQAANESFGLPGATAPTTASDVGDPVAIIDSSDLRLRQVAVEGASARQTTGGPGHVVGTAGPGQPGNSVIVGRRALFGGPFGSIDTLEQGDRILVTTTQGQSVYVVGHVGQHRIRSSAEAAETASTPSTNLPASTGSASSRSKKALLPKGALTEEQVFGPSDDDRLTLVTSASGNPTATDQAQVVVAKLDGLPFTPTPQGGRTSTGTGRTSSGGASAGLILALLAYSAAVVAAMAAYRRLPWRSAYLLSAPVLVALTVVLAEQVGRMLPAWA